MHQPDDLAHHARRVGVGQGVDVDVQVVGALPGLFADQVLDIDASAVGRAEPVVAEFLDELERHARLGDGGVDEFADLDQAAAFERVLVGGVVASEVVVEDRRRVLEVGFAMGEGEFPIGLEIAVVEKAVVERLAHADAVLVVAAVAALIGVAAGRVVQALLARAHGADVMVLGQEAVAAVLAVIHDALGGALEAVEQTVQRALAFGRFLKRRQDRLGDRVENAAFFHARLVEELREPGPLAVGRSLRFHGGEGEIGTVLAPVADRDGGVDDLLDFVDALELARLAQVHACVAELAEHGELLPRALEGLGQVLFLELVQEMRRHHAARQRLHVLRGGQRDGEDVADEGNVLEGEFLDQVLRASGVPAGLAGEKRGAFAHLLVRLDVLHGQRSGRVLERRDGAARDDLRRVLEVLGRLRRLEELHVHFAHQLQNVERVEFEDALGAARKVAGEGEHVPDARVGQRHQ